MIGLRWLKRLWRLSFQSPVDSPKQVHKIIAARVVIIGLLWLSIMVFMLVLVVVLILLTT